jgi:hypothetical protein
MLRRFLLSMVLALCGFTAARAEQDLYHPLAVGLRWDVDVELTANGGETQHGSVVREIVGTQKIGLYTYFVVTTTVSGLPNMKDFTMYRRKSARGVYGISALDKTKQEHLEAALPLTVGQIWKTTVGGQTITSAVEGKEPVKIGDKTYEDCVKVSYRSGDGNVKGTFYQAPDVGNVQETTVANGMSFKFTLKKFSGLK